MTFFISYNFNGEEIRKHDKLQGINPTFRVVAFPDRQTRDAAWSADATFRKAVEEFGGVQVTL